MTMLGYGLGFSEGSSVGGGPRAPVFYGIGKTLGMIEEWVGWVPWRKVQDLPRGLILSMFMCDVQSSHVTPTKTLVLAHECSMSPS